MIKIIITARNVSDVDMNAITILERAGYQIEEHPNANQYSKEEFIRILQDVDAVIAGLEIYTKEIFDNAPSLKLIARRGVGVDNIDLETAKEHDVKITRTEGLVGASVAELIMTYILDHARMLSSHTKSMNRGTWSRTISEGAKGKTLGLVGFGGIAKETAVRANAFGMKVLCYYRHRDIPTEQHNHVEYADFDKLIRESDYVSINVPLTTQTKDMFDKSVFDRMKKSSILINTSRSGIVNMEDLVFALNSKIIGGAYIDVYDYEPCTDSPLLSCENVFLTPHIGTFTKETFIAMNNRCAEEIIRFFN